MSGWREDRYRDNYQLSEFRAHIISNYVRARLGLDPEQVTIEGRGPDQPIGNNATKEGRDANNRVHLFIYKPMVHLT